jgi:hypothetical protein
MANGTDTATAITSILTVGVGGMVGYVKRYIRLALDEAAKVREMATQDLEVIKADIEQIKSAVVRPARKAPAKKATARKPSAK